MVVRDDDKIISEELDGLGGLMEEERRERPTVLSFRRARYQQLQGMSPEQRKQFVTTHCPDLLPVT